MAATLRDNFRRAMRITIKYSRQCEILLITGDRNAKKVESEDPTNSPHAGCSAGTGYNQPFPGESIRVQSLWLPGPFFAIRQPSPQRCCLRRVRLQGAASVNGIVGQRQR
jgi:hypothetical protein